MDRALRFCLALALVVPASFATRARAQTGSADEDLAEDETSSDEDADDEPRLRPPSIEPIAIAPEEDGADEDAPDEDGPDEDRTDDGDDEGEPRDATGSGDATLEEQTLPSPQDADARLDVGGNPLVEPWTRPQTVFELHGYMRMRGEFQDQFSLGRGRANRGVPDMPFELFIPRDDYGARVDEDMRFGAPAGGCAGPGGNPEMPAACNQRALAFANMRLRLEPTIHLSDDVRVRMQIDVFDNLVMGSTPEGLGVQPYGFGGGYRVYGSSVPLTSFSQSQSPPRAGFNSWSDSIMVRRAWAEVRNRGLGELRFGRMGNHWGLGILANGGTGIDADYQSDVDRIMAITRLVGFYFFGAWDFASEGYIYENPWDYRVPFDAVRNDDVDQFTFGIARRTSDDETTSALQRGEAVLDGGIFFVYRNQNLTSEGTPSPLDPFADPVLLRRSFEVFVPDVWVRFLYENLRLELEATMIIGTIGNLQPPEETRAVASRVNDILSFGMAFEGEYHLLDNQLGIYFNAGVATADADVEGLTRVDTGIQFQQDRPGGRDTNLTMFSFHPNYRIDLIFWRTIMRQFSSAYYFRPGLSYDFIRSSFGQLLGARADVIWSRAMEPVQTWGNQPDIGVEIDAQVYYRSEDGPDLLDGFYASIQYGIFFPLGALGYLPGQRPTMEYAPFQGGQNAQTLRLILGVQY